MISDLFGEIADVPLPPPNQWDPSHKSVLPSAFSRTPRILWLQRGIRNQLRYWSTPICTSQCDWESCDCRGPLTPHHALISRVKQRLQRPAQPIMKTNYSHQFIVSLSLSLSLSPSLLWSWRKVATANGLSLYKVSPQIVSLSGEIHCVLKDFLWAELSLEELFPLCGTLLWLELHTTREIPVGNLLLSRLFMYSASLQIHNTRKKRLS